MKQEFKVEQKRKLCELLNGMEKAAQLDDRELFERIKENYADSIVKFLGLSIADPDFNERFFEFDLILNAYSNAYLFRMYNLPGRVIGNALEKARGLKSRYFHY